MPSTFTGVSSRWSHPLLPHRPDPGPASRSHGITTDLLPSNLYPSRMQTRALGSRSLEVGEIGLGCMPMSWGYVGDATSEDKLIAVVHRALDLGVTLLDTADCYGPFTNEELVGRALVGHRNRAVIATKAGLVVGPNGWY